MAAFNIVRKGYYPGVLVNLLAHWFEASTPIWTHLSTNF